MLVLSNEEIESVLTMDLCIEALEDVYRELGQCRAANTPRIDLLSPSGRPGALHGLKTMCGAVPGAGVAALRINSDIVHWPEIGGVARRVKIPAAPGNRWVGLVILFSTETGEPLTIFPDGVMQRMRVAGTSAVAAKRLARPEASALGILGSGWQAGAHVMAMCAVRPIREVRVYSPTRENRVRFAGEMTATVGVKAVVVDRPEDVAEQADIVVCATNALAGVFQAKWLRPGMHVTCVRVHELEPQVLQRCDVVVINSHKGQPDHYFVGGAPQNIPELTEGWENPAYHSIGWDRLPEMADLLDGRAPARTAAEQMTCFCNNIGLGVQFAAVGALVLKLAREKGLGRELPVDWFVQNVHP